MRVGVDLVRVSMIDDVKAAERYTFFEFGILMGGESANGAILTCTHLRDEGALGQAEV